MGHSRSAVAVPRLPLPPRFAVPFAVALALLVVPARWALDLRPGDSPHLVLFVPPILVAAYVGGPAGGLAATATAAVASGPWLLRALEEQGPRAALHVVAWTALVAMGLLAALLLERARRARERLETGEETLRRATDRMHLLVEHTPAAVAVLDRQMRYLAVSRRYREDYQLGERDVLGRSHYDVFPEIPERWREIHRRCLAGAVERAEDDPFPRSDGRMDRVSWEVRPWRDDAGELGGIVIFSEVTTARWEAMTRLAAERERLAVTLRSIGDAVIATDGLGRVSLMNPTAEALTGWTAHEALGRPVSDVFRVVREDTWQPVESPVERALRDGVAVTLGARSGLVARDGVARPVEASGAPMRGEDGRVVGVVLVFRDRTEERRAARVLRELEQQFQQAQKLESLGRLAGGIAHDFNNILTVILSCATSIEEDLASGAAPRAEDAAEIGAAAERARDLTRQLLAFARKQVVAPISLDINEVLRASEKMLGRLLGEDVSLQVKLEPGLWGVRADPGQIEQVLMNLAVNARDAMARGGVLAIETRNVAADGVPLAADGPGGDRVQLLVRDDGVGMTPEVKAHLFEPFFTTKERGKGTGLGLATVYGIVQQAGGRIEVESEPGRGSTFRISFPRGAPAPGPRPSPAAAERVQGTETILAVEDDVQVRGVVAHALRGSGYRVLVAGSGAEALSLLAEEPGPVHLAITDVVMPGLGGRDLAVELRRRRAGLKILFVSGYSDEVISHHGVLDAGVELLQKPFTGLDLVARVRRILDAS